MNSAVGPLSYRQDQESFQKPFSEHTGRLIDDEVRKMVADAHRRTTELLTTHRDSIAKVAELLLEKEVLTRDDMLALLGPRPHGDSYDEALALGGPAVGNTDGAPPGANGGIEGGLGGGLGNPVPEPQGIDGGPGA